MCMCPEYVLYTTNRPNLTESRPLLNLGFTFGSAQDLLRLLARADPGLTQSKPN